MVLQLSMFLSIPLGGWCWYVHQIHLIYSSSLYFLIRSSPNSSYLRLGTTVVATLCPALGSIVYFLHEKKKSPSLQPVAIKPLLLVISVALSYRLFVWISPLPQTSTSWYHVPLRILRRLRSNFANFARSEVTPQFLTNPLARFPTARLLKILRSVEDVIRSSNSAQEAVSS